MEYNSDLIEVERKDQPFLPSVFAAACFYLYNSSNSNKHEDITLNVD